MFVSLWVRRKTPEWGRCFVCFFSQTACHHLAVSPPFFFYSCCCWESRSSQACPRPAYQLAKKPFTCKPGQHFIVFFLWEIMRACINVWHSCRVMSSLRSWLLSSGTCCNARDQPRHSRSALPPTGVVARVVYERARFRRRLDFWWENWIEHWWDLKRFRFFFCGFCFE